MAAGLACARRMEPVPKRNGEKPHERKQMHASEYEQTTYALSSANRRPRYCGFNMWYLMLMKTAQFRSPNT